MGALDSPRAICKELQRWERRPTSLFPKCLLLPLNQGYHSPICQRRLVPVLLKQLQPS